MNPKRIAMVVALAVAIGLCLAPMTSQANVVSVDRAAADGSCAQNLDSTAARPVTGPKCIPCSPNHVCVNPLTVCSYSGSSTHGCCIGYAGQN